MKASLIEREDALVLEPQGPATASVVWLHGLGADGYDFLPFAQALGLAERGVRVVLPHAPRRPVTINGGYVMRAWYDVHDPDLARDPDEGGIRGSVDLVTHFLAREITAGVPSTRLVVAGFSQGGVLALEAGLRFAERLAGIIGLSAYLALPAATESEASPANRGLPVFLGHGDHDPVIPLALGELSAARLAGLGYQVQLRRYPMAHAVCDAEAADVDHWLRRALG